MEPRIQAITGLSAAQAVGRPIWEIQSWLEPPEVRTAENQQRLRETTLHALSTGEASWLGRLLERSLEHPDGTRRFLQSVTFPVRTGKGIMFGSILRDITDKHRAEEMIRLQGAALDAAANAMVITDLQGAILWANPAFTNLTGYTLEEARGQNPRLFNPIAIQPASTSSSGRPSSPGRSGRGS